MAKLKYFGGVWPDVMQAILPCLGQGRSSSKIQVLLGTQLVRTYDITNETKHCCLCQRAAMAGISQIFIGLGQDGFRLFITPSSSGEGIHFIDMDRDGEDEMVITRQSNISTLLAEDMQWNGTFLKRAGLSVFSNL